MERMGIGSWRRASIAIVATVAMSTALVVRSADADEVAVPIALQVQLLGRVASYDRTFSSRTGTPATILVVERRGNVESTRAAAQLAAALRRSPAFAGRPLVVEMHAFSSAAALRASVDASSASIVYLTPGLGGETRAIAAGLAGSPVISVSAVSADVERGVVVGFELVETRPKLVVNLRQARLQRVDFSSQFLRIARVIS